MAKNDIFIVAYKKKKSQFFQNLKCKKYWIQGHLKNGRNCHKISFTFNCLKTFPSLENCSITSSFLNDFILGSFLVFRIFLIFFFFQLENASQKTYFSLTSCFKNTFGTSEYFQVHKCFLSIVV